MSCKCRCCLIHLLFIFISQSADGKCTHFLFVDNLLPTEIVICFSALTQWGESVEESKNTWWHSYTLFVYQLLIKRIFGFLLCLERVSPPRPGFLTAKPFSWKSIVSELPVVQIQTTASKAALLTLPPG